MTTLLRIASHTIVLAIGLAGGFYFGFGAGKGNSLALDMLEADYYSTYAAMQFAEGTDSTREETLHVFIALAEKRKGRWTPIFTEKGYAIDSAVANARLFALAKKRGSMQEAQQYLDRAVLFCPQTGWRECSGEKIIAFSQKLDKHKLFDDLNPQ